MNSLSSGVNFLANGLLRGAIWLLFIGAVSLLLRRASAARRALLWQSAFAGLILLPIVLLCLPPLKIQPAVKSAPPTSTEAAPWPVLPVNRPLPSSAMPPSAPPITRPEKAFSSSPLSNTSSAPSPSTEANSTSSSAYKNKAFQNANAGTVLITSSPHHLITPLLLSLWSAGTLWLLLRLLVSLSLLHRLGSSSVSVSPELEAEAKVLSERLGLRSPVTLRIAGDDSALMAPVTWGVFRPVALLPTACTEETENRRRAALLHELAHIRRRDWAWLLLAQIACAFYWCVPCVWTAACRLRHEIELACDDCVLANGITAPDYAAQILAVVRAMNAERANLPVSALTMARPPLAQTRIQAILAAHARRQPVSRMGLAWAMLLPALFIPLLSLHAVAAIEKPRRLLLSAGIPEPQASKLSSSASPSAPLLADVRSTATHPAIPGSPLRLPQPDGDGGALSPETALPGNTILDAQNPQDGIPLLKDLPIIGHLFMNKTAPKSELSDRARGQEPQPPVSAENGKKRVPVLGDIPLIGHLFQNDAGGEVAWGKAQDNLQAGIRFRENRQRYYSGETLEVDYLLRNVGEKEIGLDPATWKMPAAQFTITTQARTNLQRGDTRAAQPLHTPVAVIKPGETVVIESFRLETSAQAFSRPTPLLVTEGGKYRLTQQRKILLAGERDTALDLQSGWMDFEIVSTAALARWGNAEHGLQAGVAFTGNRQKFEIGDTVSMDLYWRNATNMPMTVSYIMYNNNEYLADLETTAGTPVHLNYTFIDIPPLIQSATLKPGETLCVGHPHLLLVREKKQGLETQAEVKPGWYRIRMKSVIPPFKPPYQQIESDYAVFEVVENQPAVEKPIFWGEESHGFQLGARIASARSTFKVGETIDFQAFGRNLSGQDTNLSVGNYWKVNYKVQVQTLEGKPVYMERNKLNRAELVAGYREESFGKGATQEISKAALRILKEPQERQSGTLFDNENTWAEAVPLKPGRYRVRLLSWSLFGRIKPQPASGWIPIEVKAE